MAEAFRLAGQPRFGGGGYNSTVALRMAEPSAPLRYLDSSVTNADLCETLGHQGVETRFLERHPPVGNLILPCAGGHVILHSPEAEKAETAPPEVELDWICEAGGVLANGLKDRSLMTRLVSEPAYGAVRLYSVMTGSLPSSYWIRTVMPRARATFLSFDECERVLGLNPRHGMVVALDAVRLMLSFQNEGVAFLTSGIQGVLAGQGDAIYQVRLKPAASEEVERLLGGRSTRTLGCGDAFAAGAFAAMERAHASQLPSGIDAAIAGCLSSIRWLGLGLGFAEDDFAVDEAGRFQPAAYLVRGRRSGATPGLQEPHPC